ADGVNDTVAAAELQGRVATWEEIQFGAALGFAFGTIDPVGSAGSLIVGSGSQAIGNFLDRVGIGDGTYGSKGYLIGSMAGNLIGGGVDDVLFNGASVSHAVRQTAVRAAITSGAVGVAYQMTDDLATSLMIGNLASVPAGMVAKKLVKCFVAGTPVWIPQNSAVGLFSTANLPRSMDTPLSSVGAWQITLGACLIAAGAITEARTRSVRSRQTDPRLRSRASSFGRPVFGSPDANWNWIDLVIEHWALPEGPLPQLSF
ncbi:MAG: hypothetical protein AAFX06_33170, partial [Planctomycetota bacterium]